MNGEEAMMSCLPPTGTPRKKEKQAIKIYEELGSGSFGKVYRAFDPALNTVVAVKMIELDTSAEIDEILLELRFLSELKSEYVVKHFGSTLYDSVLFITMEYCEIGSCLYMLREFKVFREESAAYIIHEVLKGLQYIHGQSKIHRDLKCANILVNSDCKVKIADFGVSAQLSQTLPDRRSFMGTPYWMAPEIIKSVEYNTNVDIWSLGIVVFELITGVPPYRTLEPSDAMQRIVRNNPPQLPSVVRGRTVSKGLCDLVAACLTKNPKKRPSSTDVLNMKYMRSRRQIPHDFRTMVCAILRSKSKRGKDIEPDTLTNIAALAPPKSRRSRPDSCNATGSLAGRMCDEFDLTSHDVGVLESPSPAPDCQRHSLLVKPALQCRASPNNKAVPGIPPRIHPPRVLLAEENKLRVQCGQADKPAQQPQHPQVAQPKPVVPPRRAEITSETLSQWMRKALAGVESRTRVPKAVDRITHLGEEIESINADFPGFTRALIEELWRVIIENKHGQ